MFLLIIKMSVIKSDEISISEYIKRFQQNASQSWTQCLQPVSATKSSCMFNFSSSGYDCLMGAQLFLYVKYNISNVTVDFKTNLDCNQD